MSADFRQLAAKGESGRAERLFRAAVSAYCALVRPTRREAQQLDDLALPLYQAVPPAARRYAAAALSECDRPPPLLARRLAGEPVEVSAPLLVRSPAIGDADLIALIARHGLPHARAIARRRSLNPVIAGLLDALKDPEIRRLRGAGPRPALHAVPPAPAPPPRTAANDSPVEAVRHRLRAMMRPAGERQTAGPPAAADGNAVFARLRETALSGHLPFFQTALADALNTDLATARALVDRGGGYRELCAALRELGLSEEQAFMIVAALFPEAAASAEEIRLFLYRYRLHGAERSLAEPAPAEVEADPAPEPIRRVS